MTVRPTESGSIALEGVCSSEDAEVLLQQLLCKPGTPVDWRGCQGVHTAVLQVLMAARPQLIGPPTDPNVRDWVVPILTDAL